MKLIDVGYGNMVSASRIVAIVSPDSAPTKRMVSEARENGRVIDATCGKRTQAVIFTDSEHIILTGLKSEKLIAQFNRESLDNQ